MIIEQANKKDHLTTIAQFQVDMALETEELNLELEIVLKGVAAVFDDSSKGKYFVALDDQRNCVASLLTVNEWSDWRCKNVIWIHSVFVVKSMRGSKVFKKMYEYLQKQVSENSELAGLRLYVDKRNTKASAVYEKIGMTKEHYDLYEWLE